MKKLLKILLKILLYIILIIILLALGTILYEEFTNKARSNTIIATKTETLDGTRASIEYRIKINDYKYEKITKELTFKTEEWANNEYERYQVKKDYEGKDIEIELKGKKLIITMSVLEFLKDIEYEPEVISEMEAEEGFEIERVDQKEIEQYLISHGYTAK